jgi:PAS domain S-box-containing protein
MEEYVNKQRVDKQAEQEAHSRNSTKGYVGGALILLSLFVAVLGYFAGEYVVSIKREGLDERHWNRTQFLARGKARVLEEWLNLSAKIGFQVTNFKIVQDFSKSLPAGLAGPLDETPKGQQIQRVLEEFVAQNNLAGAYIATKRGQPAVMTADIEELAGNYESDIYTAGQSPSFYAGTFRLMQGVPVVDIYQPILSSSGKVNAVLAMVVPATEMITNILRPDPVSGEHEYVNLFQLDEMAGIGLVKTDEGIQIHPWKSEASKEKFKEEWRIYRNDDGVVRLSRKPSFGRSKSIPLNSEVLAARFKVKNSNFIIIAHTDMFAAYQPILAFRKYVHIITQLSVFLIFAVGFGLWWWKKQNTNQTLISQYQELTDKISEQKNLLSSINSSVKEYIALKSLSGTYTYVNPAYAFALGQPAEKLEGVKDKEVFEEDDAQLLEKMDLQAFTEGRAEDTIKLKIHGKPRTLEVSKTLVRDRAGAKSGLVFVARDITELANERRLKENALKNSISALLRVVERHDSYLARHSKYVNHVVMALATKMHYKVEDKTTLDIASHLFLVGKVFVPQDILKKEISERTAEEKDMYESHVENTGYILDTVNWKLPVVRTVYQMFEELDGSGYPNGLKGDDVFILSRVMHVCDVFCSLISPRSGHKHLTPEEAIRYLRDNKEKYDLRIVEKLAELIVEDPSVLMAV